MKRIVWAILAMTAATAWAGWRNDLTGERATSKPEWLVYDGAVVYNAPAEAYAAAGWREDTAAELAAAAQAAQEQAAQAQAALLAEIAPVASMMKYALVAQFGTNVFADVPTVQEVTAHFYGKRMAGTLTALDAADWDILNDGYAFIVEKFPAGITNIPWASIP